MSIPFFFVALGLSCGIIAERFTHPPVFWVACFLGSGMPLLWFLRGRRYFLPVFVLLLACGGILWARLDSRVPSNAVQNFPGQEKITLRGVVVSLPEVRSRGKKETVSLVLEARSITKKEGSRRKFLRVSGHVQVFLLQANVLPQVGDELRLYGELTSPRVALNPGEFDYGEFLAQKKIRAIFQTIGRRCVHVTRSGDAKAPSRILAELRRRLAVMIGNLYSPSEAAVLKALVLGMRSDVSPEVRNQFMKTGTIHLFATANTKRDFAPFSNKIIAANSPQPIGR